VCGVEANRPPRWSCGAPLDRRAVRAAAPTLLALVAALAAEAGPAAQGGALAAQLVSDADSPPYAPGDRDALREIAAIARRSLG
jgi:hypothetical protein